ncbi:MAG: hypothetical protein ACN4E2_07565 [Nitrospinota bacterium]
MAGTKFRRVTQVESDIIRYDITYGRCAICDGTVYLTSTMDAVGNKINALHCWNGHYKNIDIVDLDISHLSEVTVEDARKIIPFIGFIKINDDSLK